MLWVLNGYFSLEMAKKKTKKKTNGNILLMASSALVLLICPQTQVTHWDCAI